MLQYINETVNKDENQASSELNTSRGNNNLIRVRSNRNKNNVVNGDLSINNDALGDYVKTEIDDSCSPKV